MSAEKIVEISAREIGVWPNDTKLRITGHESEIQIEISFGNGKVDAIFIDPNDLKVVVDMFCKKEG
jgi:YbbR domain-containing protein